jgi:hypothetical protein
MFDYGINYYNYTIMLTGRFIFGIGSESKFVILGIIVAKLFHGK